MFEVCQNLDHLDGAAPLLLIKRGDVDACHHFVGVSFCVIDQEDLAITLTEVERDD